MAIKQLQKLGFLFGGLVVLLLSGCGKKDGGDTSYPAPTPAVLAQPTDFVGTPFDNPDNPVTVEGIALGRALFFDPALSRDGSISCASCHNPRLGFSDTNRLSRGVHGQLGRRQSMGLANLRFERHFFWDGRASTLEEQAQLPIQDPKEMAMTPLLIEQAIAKNQNYKPLFGKAFQSEEITFTKATKALAQYVRSLSSFDSKFDRWRRGQADLTTEELAGFKLFMQHPYPERGIRGANCGDCHNTDLFFGTQNGFEGFKNNGTSSEETDDPGLMGITRNANDFGKFKIPSLRNIALTPPYMHDGRFKTLEEVMDHYNNPELQYRPHIDPLITVGSNSRFGGGLELTDDEKLQVIAFLHTLTDTTLAGK